MTRPTATLTALALAVTTILGGADAAATHHQVANMTVPLTGGGDAEIQRDGNTLRVTVRGPRAGLASLCVAGADEVRILHASAAVGEAVFARTDATWKLTTPFEFKLRDTPNAPPSDQDRTAFLNSQGWVANADRTGGAARRFTIALSNRVRALGITFFTTSEPMAISYWPSSMDDDCRAVKVAQGFLPVSATFRPTGWHQLR